jgi:hypothetical protein
MRTIFNVQRKLAQLLRRLGGVSTKGAIILKAYLTRPSVKSSADESTIVIADN